jgi:hypothetical protein
MLEFIDSCEAYIKQLAAPVNIFFQVISHFLDRRQPLHYLFTGIPKQMNAKLILY